MEVTEFKRLLDIGLGRIPLFLQENSAVPYREIIMNACLHNMALDRQSEGSRARYMLDVIEQTSEKEVYREQILTALVNLAPDLEDYDVEQLFDFAKLFALQGDQEARQAIYTGFLKRVSPQDVTGATTIIELDGLQGFRFVAAQLGEFALTDPDFTDDDYLLTQAEEQSSPEEVSDLLQTAQISDRRIAAYIQVALESRAQREQHRQKREIDVAELTYKDVEAVIYSRSGGLALLRRWGQQASNTDLFQVAQKLQTEDVPAILRRLLAVFRKVRFPLDYQRLFELSQHDDEQVAALAIAALENINHLGVRDFALNMISQSFHVGRMTALLAKNYQEGDWQLIEELTQRELTPEDYHNLGVSVRDIFAAHPTPASTAALLNLYEKGPCAICRVSVIKCLYQLAAIPAWMIEECQRDSNFGLRKYAQMRFEGLELGW